MDATHELRRPCGLDAEALPVEALPPDSSVDARHSHTEQGRPARWRVDRPAPEANGRSNGAFSHP